MDDDQERDVARGLQEGRVEAWRALYEAHVHALWQAVARLMGPRSEDVADVVQETFLAAARSARSYDPSRGSLWLWLTGIARHHVALSYRKQERQERIKMAADRVGGCLPQVIGWLENRHPTPHEALESAELATLVRAALAQLPTDYETLLTGRYLDDIPVERLAGMRRCSPAALRSRLARARRAFREILAKSCPVTPGGPARGAS